MTSKRCIRFAKTTRAHHLCLSLVVSLIFMFSSSESQAQWLSGYSYRVRITIQGSQVCGSTDFSNFPVLIQANGTFLRPAPDGLITNSNGYDIRFTRANGVTVLDHQIDHYYSASGTYAAWVRIPTLSATGDTEIYMYYGNSSVTTDPSTTGTWNNSFRTVYHFQNNNFNDGTVNGINGTNNGTTNAGTAKIGQGRSFDGTNDFIQTTSNDFRTLNNLTVSVWFRANSTNPGHILWQGQTGENGWGNGGIGGAGQEMHLSMGTCCNAAGNALSWYLGTTEVQMDPDGLMNSTAFTNTTDWHYLVGTMSNLNTSPQAQLYLDGVLIGTDNGTTAATGRDLWEAANRLIIGKPSANERYYNGQLDEIRISNTVRSADWICTEFNNQNSNGTFLSFVNAAPVLDNIEGTGLNYTEGNPATLITSAITISDENDGTMSGAIIQITSNYANGEDVLQFTNANNISGAWNASTGTLELTGVSSVANYQAALRSVRYINTNTGNPSAATRTVSFTVNDGTDDSNIETRNINFTAVNDAPVATNDNAMTAEDNAVVINVLANDSDVDDALVPASVAIVSGPSNGGVSINTTTGAITYTPNANYNGGDSFTYTVNDAAGATSNTATVNITINAVNDTPVAVDDNVTTDEDNAVVIAVLANDSDVENALDPASVAIVSGPSNGGVSINTTTGAITYTPNANYNGSDSFTYTVDDAAGTPSNTATVNITVNAVNDTPVAADDNATTDEDNAVVIAVLANDADVENALDPASVAIVSGPANGGVSINTTTGEITYTPNANYNGGDSFTYTVNDAAGATSNTATVNITINAVNDTPVTADDNATTDEDNAVVIAVLANDSDVENALNPASVAIVSGPSNGGVSINTTTGAITYTPNANYNGSDSFTYTVNDAAGATSNTATVNITVNAVNDTPVAADDNVTTDEDNAVVIAVLANDSDVENALDPASVAIVSGPSNGGVSINTTTGEITYTPNANYNGGDSFTYTVDDAAGTPSNIATVNITINAVNDTPVAVDDNVSTPEDNAVVIAVLANDSDVENALDPASVAIVSAPSNGGVSINTTTGEITYTPNANYNGGDSFTYTVDDAAGTPSNIATVSITVNAVNDTPVAVDDNVSTPEDNAIVIAVLANDTDVENALDPASVAIVSAPSNGGVSINTTTGEITYTPNANYNGGDSFTYTVDDAAGTPSNIATVSITVNAVNDTPVAVDDNVSTPEDNAIVIAVLANDTDVENALDPASVAIVSAPSNGGVSINTTTGEITYTPNANYNGGDSFTYTVDDAAGTPSNIATVNITVNAVNDTPVAVDDNVTTTEDNALVIAVLANDSDVENALDLASVVIVSAPANGGVSINTTTGEITYTPNANYNGGDSFTYTVNDAAGATSNTATVNITVNAVNDTPVAVDDNVSTPEDNAIVIAVLANDADVENALDPASVAIVSGPANGGVSINTTTGEITYTPNANYNGSDSFTYTVNDAAGATSNTATVSITINAVNDTPVAADDNATTDEDNAVVIAVLTNDADVENALDPASVAIVSAPANGGVSINATTGEITYTPNANYNGGDSFTYTVDDAAGATSNTATVNITVNAVNDTPVAVDDNVTTDEDNAVVIAVLANDSDVENALDPASVAIVSGPANGGVSINTTTGAITYTPNANYNGSDSFTYTVNDAAGATSNTATVNIAINAVNDTPVAVDDNVTTDEDNAVVIAVLANDVDVENALDPASVAIVSGPANGGVFINTTTGAITYTPNANYNGSDSFTYTVNDAAGANSNIATVNITINPVNDAPVAVNDNAITTEDNAVIIDILANDSDVDNALAPASVAIVSGPSNGGVSINTTTGEITYTPNANYNGFDTFTYTVEDASGTPSNIATVSIAIGAVNNAPVAVNDNATTPEDNAVVIAVLANDADIDNALDPASVAIVSGPSNGGVSINTTTGEITYTPNANYNGSDSFTYTVNDAAGATSNIATVSITINSVNDTPVAADDNVTTSEDNSVVIAVLANDTDVENALDPASVAIVSGPANGGVSINTSTGEITYTPNANYNGADSFTYTVDDAEGTTSNTATVSITITPVNDTPVAVDDNATTAEDNAVVIDVLANDSDIDNDLDPTSVVIVGTPTNGIVSVNTTTGEITYTPNANYHGTESFTYTVKDACPATSNIATVNITVTPINDAPVATDDNVTTSEDNAIVIAVLANDADVENALDPASVAIVSAPSNGGVSINTTTGEITYTPNANYNGSDSFTYTVDDAAGATSNTATVNITVTPVNDAPVAVNDNATTSEDNAVVIDVLANDSDIDNALDPASVVIVSAPANGSVSINTTTGEITYTPNADYNGADSFTYTVDDAAGATSNTATVNITVTSVNDAPVAVDDNATTSEDNAVVIDVLANDSDIDNSLDPASVVIVSAPANGGVSINTTTGEITYTPNANYNGADSFTYTVDDAAGATCNTATVNITVTPVNDAPVAVDDNATTDEDIAVLIDVLANDSDVDNALVPTSVTIVSAPSNGGASINTTTGEITYTPNADYNGTDVFTYTVDDVGGATSNIATVNITVTPVNDAPVAVNDNATTSEDNAVVIDVLANDSDIDNALDPASVVIVSAPANGGVSINTTTGEVTYTPNANYNGADSFTYTVDDAAGVTSNIATVSITVTPVNDAPVTVNDNATTDEDIAVVIDVLANDSDVDHPVDPSSITIVDSPDHGSLTLNLITGEVTYTPDASFNGSDSFTYEIIDGGSLSSNTATVNITVIPVNDAPVAVDDNATTNEDNAVVIDVLANDSDIDNALDPASVVIVSAPSNGGVSINTTTGEITYTPNVDYNGVDSFTYTVNDAAGETSNTATVNITVTPVNDAPVATDDNVTTNEDIAVVINVVANDSDIENALDLTSVIIASAPSNGGVTVNTTTGEITYTPNADYNGTDVFTYTVDDAGGATSNIAIVNITVTPVNDAPVAMDDNATTAEDNAVVIDVLVNDGDQDNALNPASVVVISQPAHGTVSIQSSGEVTYTPQTDFNGSDTFTYTVSDLAGGVSNVATVFVTITPVNDAPVAISDNATTEREIAVDISVLSNDTDIDSPVDPASLAVVSLPTNGSVSINSTTGDITYTPSSGFVGTDSFTYTITDAGGLTSSPALVTIVVTPVNQAPEAINDGPILHTSIHPITIDVLLNDSDPDHAHEELSIVSVTQPAFGTVTIVNGELIYQPEGQTSATVIFTYTIQDPAGLTSQATVTIQYEFAELQVSEGFSPNNDGSNETWYIQGIESYPVNSILVYDRWGMLVYEAKDYDNSSVAWDGRANHGTQKGNLLDKGTYYYILNLGSEGGTRNGYVVIIR